MESLYLALFLFCIIILNRRQSTLTLARTPSVGSTGFICSQSQTKSSHGCVASTLVFTNGFDKSWSLVSIAQRISSLVHITPLWLFYYIIFSVIKAWASLLWLRLSIWSTVWQLNFYRRRKYGFVECIIGKTGMISWSFMQKKKRLRENTMCFHFRI